MRRIVLLGAGGHAREVAEVARACSAAGQSVEVVGYLTDPGHAPTSDEVGGLPVLGGIDWLAERAGEVLVVGGVGAPELRARLVQHAAKLGARFGTFVHPDTTVGRQVKLGEGCVVMAGARLTCDIRLGDHVLVNQGCTVGHDAEVGSFATLMPGVRLSGNVTVGEGAMLGVGSVVLERRRIGAWSRVGAGAVVLEDAAENSTVVGVPAREVRRRAPGWHRGEDVSTP